MVNVLKLWTLFSFCPQIKCGLPWLEFTKCLTEQQTGKILISSLVWVCSVCLYLLSRQEVFKILEHLPYNFQHCYTLNIYLSNRMRFLNSCGELRHRYFNVILDNLCSSHFFKFTWYTGFQAHLILYFAIFQFLPTIEMVSFTYVLHTDCDSRLMRFDGKVIRPNISAMDFFQVRLRTFWSALKTQLQLRHCFSINLKIPVLGSAVAQW